MTERDLSFQDVDNPNPKALTQEQIAFYNQNGYLKPFTAFDAEDADRQRAYFDDLVARVQAERADFDSYAINGFHSSCRGIYDVVTNPLILDHVEDLIGPNIIAWGTHFFSKLPHDPKKVAWHQDASYWPLSPSKTVTVWLAIDDADIDNGAMQFVAGSHRGGQIAFEWSKPEEDNVLGQSVHDPGKYGAEEVAIEMTAGQISLHSDLLLHGSEPNASDRRRCGLTMRYCATDVRALQGWHLKGVLLSGEDPEGHWANPPRPAQD